MADIGERAARGEDGKTYYVPSDMTYNEWKNELTEKTKNAIIGYKTIVNDEEVTAIMSKHIADRANERGVTQEDIKDALENPLHDKEVVIDKNGKPSFQRIGRKATVVINPDTFVMPSVWKTGKKNLKKYGEKS
jgi:uncharacterized hydantoinase/oxoprolinase family protein